ncbi:MAG: orotate phosphoribosyltransferase [Victivallaceae bacterium]|nr:orotate phosphoribosyltransferase [Victivallaceae bacterium]NLK83347.1 orotate phosphoribosyltransferase [Lentisphaerota bacterium]MDD3115801.1 orotate phosphoribosyltransferase [Victivallaceae bacterium]MDD3702918.1 orotate phosphoribosyltransferase [Victivallaceae bacterium]MDD4317270.1 orotate phosphoribosyltransferase [Victivallaceae bacterium]
MNLKELQAELASEEIIDMMKQSKALLEGHFQLRSGLHSDRFFQAALLLQHPDLAEKTCRQLARFFNGCQIDCVISPAVGGLIVGHELGRALGVRAIFADKDNDKLVLKRGFSITPGEKVLVAEDVITRGGRVQQTIDLARSFGAEIVGVGVIVDRSGGQAKFDVPHYSLLQLELETYEPETCPLCKQGVALERPGSK